MQYSPQLFSTTVHTTYLTDVRFFNPETKLGDAVFFIGESNNLDNQTDINKFLNRSNRAFIGEITIPGIIPNFIGKKLSSQKHYTDIKKQFPAFKFNRIPSPKNVNDKTQIFDMSYLAPDIVLLSKSRSKKMVMDEFFKLNESIIKDYNPGISKCLLIYGDNKLPGSSADFLHLLGYYFKLNGNRIKTNFDGFVYFMNNKYYALTHTEFENEAGGAQTKYLKLNLNIFNLILTNKDKLSKGSTESETFSIEQNNIDSLKNIQDLKTKIKELSSKLEDSEDDEKKDTISQIKSLLEKEPTLTGTFEEKLHSLFKMPSHEEAVIEQSNKANKDTTIDNTATKILELHHEINDKYNGLVDVVIPQLGVFDTQEIVGLKTLSSYNKQYKELMENVDEDIHALIESTLSSDPDIDIKIHDISQKIVDDNKNRYKEFSVKISHKNFGNTTDKPYTLKFRTPVVVNDKYVKIGGNNYIMISQMFPQPIVKVQPNLVRLFTNFSISHLELKNTKLNAKMNFKEVEQTLVNNLKSLNKVKKDVLFDNQTKSDIGNKYGIKDLEHFEYKQLEIVLN